jgi:ATP-dependent helicase STH1/SNF2
MITLYDYQEKEVAAAMLHDSWFNASDMGLGKTVMSVEWARRKGVKTAVVVCPLNTFESWTREITGQYPGMPVRILASDKGNVANFARLNRGEPGFYLIGWEMMRTGALTGVSADLVIADETHKQANYGKSLQSLLIRHLNSRYKLALSGTPAANKPEGIFATLNWLWPKQYSSYWKWIERYWRTMRDGAVVELVRELKPGQIIKDIPMFTRLLRSEHRDDMPPVLPEIPIPVQLTVTQRRLYDRLDQEAGVWLDEDNFMSTSVALVENLRLREICLAVPTMVDGKVTFKENSKSAKIDALIEVLTQSGLEDETFLVLTHSAKIVPVVVEKLAKKGITAAGFTGQSKADLTNFGSTYRVLVAGIAAIGEGTDGLQYKCHNMFWLSKHANALLNTQASMRLDRPGQTEPINTWYTYAVDTKDEDSLERLEEIAENLHEMIDAHR